MAGGPSTGPELNEVAWIESRYGGGGPSPSPQAQWLFEQIYVRKQPAGAKQAAEKGLFPRETPKNIPQGLKAPLISGDLRQSGLKP